jgi:hypothetical protein
MPAAGVIACDNALGDFSRAESAQRLVMRSFNQKLKGIRHQRESKHLQLCAALLLARGWKERLGNLELYER